MKKKLCPQCKIGRFRICNESGNSIVVEVDADGNIKCVHESDNLEGFNTEVLFCLGCSWKGSVRQLNDF